jgi:hypothetical protein
LECPNIPSINISARAAVKMRLLIFFSVGIFAPLTSLAAPSSDVFISAGAKHSEGLKERDNLCSLKAPPVLCQPNSTVTVEETAQRAYKFYRAFVVDGDPKTMFSLIDSTYKVSYNSVHIHTGQLCNPPEEVAIEH